MRILIFSTAYYPHVGGAEVAVKEITDRTRDFNFELICAKLEAGLPATEQIGNVLVHRVGFGNQFDKLLLPFLGCLKARQIKNSRKIDIYWSLMVTWATWAAIFNNWFSRKRVPMVLTLQEGDSEKHLRRRWFGLISLSWKIALRAADRVTAISSYLSYRAREYGWKNKVHLIPNGVDVDKFTVEELNLKDGDEFKKEIGVKSDDKFIVTASRLVEKNGVDLLIESLKYLPENYHLLILGTGALERALKKQAGDMEVEGRVHFLGFIPHEKMFNYLNASDVFSRPSRSEGMGNVFVEAMAAGVPVVATPVGGIVDFVFDPEKNPEKPATGLFAEPENPEHLARQIQRMVEDKDLRKKVIRNGRKLVEESFTWSSIAKDMKEVFISLEMHE